MRKFRGGVAWCLAAASLVAGLFAVQAPVATKAERETVVLGDIPTADVLVRDGEIPEDATVLSSYDGTYLVSFESEEQAKRAVEEERASFNTVLSIADEVVPNGVAPERTETVNPDVFDHLEEKLETAAPTKRTRKQTIALIDTGVDISMGIPVVSLLGDDGFDRHGHGTKMAEEMLTINPDLEILSIKAMDDSGYGDVATVYAAIVYAMEQDVSVINLSLVGYAVTENAVLMDVIQEATDQGILVVGAAGNHGKNVQNFIPANMDEVYVIGACDEQGAWQSFSNWGKTVDYGVTAPSTSVAAARFTAHLAAGDDISAMGTNGWLWEPKWTGTLGNLAAGVEGGFKVAATVSDSGLEQVVNNGYTYYIVPSQIRLSNADVWSATGMWKRQNCYYPGMAESGYSLYYDGVINGSGDFGDAVQIRFKDCISSVDNAAYDLLVTFTNIQYYTTEAVTYPVILAELDEEPRTTWFGAGAMNADPNIGIRMNVNYKIVRKNTNDPVDGKVLLTFTDLDRPGFTGYGGGQGQFVESVSLISGYSDPIYVEPGTYLNITNNGTSYAATQGTSGYEQEKKAGLSFLGSGLGTSFTWAGRSCWTAMNISLAIPQFTITPSKEGVGTITPGSPVTLYAGQGKSFHMVAGENNYIESITVDGSPWAVTDSQNMTYTFENVHENHTIHVVFKPNNRNVTTSVRWRDVNGDWTSYEQAEAKSVIYNSAYWYTWVRGTLRTEPSNVYYDASPNPVGNAHITTDSNFYMSVERKKYTYDFQFHAPAGHTDLEITNKQASLENKWAETMSGTVKNPALTGYTFLGWNTKADGTGSAWANEKMLSNKTFHARWKTNQYKVHYDGNGASNPDHLTGEFTQNTVTTASGMPDSTYTYDTKGTLRANDFKREGYEFTGWNTKADGTGTSYPDKYADVLNWSSADGAEITLYAQWRKKLGTETLTVVSEETGNPIPGVQVQLYKKVNGAWTALGDVRTTDGNGKVSVSDLHWFDYEWRSVVVPAGYRGMTDVNYTIKWDHLAQDDVRILYMEHVRLVLDSVVSDIIGGEEPPAFLYHVEGTDVAGVTHSYDVLVRTGADGTGSKAAPDMFAGMWNVTQTPVSRYIPGNAVNVKASMVSGTGGTANLVLNTEAEIRFPYTMRQYGYFGSMGSETNALRR